ncbi:unnamed protein product [Haemonchus placei]|uniref:Astacin domain-containing protein n=1 Tax=Haemonchus placei TaxID=6290 RepID=A0A0N4X486_HAEPC|nr:unnamed protein product [Haemonchus placei]
MQYATTAFASSGNSMTPRTAGFGRTMGSQVVSFFDIRMLNIFYQCNGKSRIQLFLSYFP